MMDFSSFSDGDRPSFTQYLFAMTDDTGIFQHSVYGVPDPQRGYTSDDNSRALILAVMLFEKFNAEEYLMLIYRYIAFLLNAQNGNGRFKNFLSYNREFTETEGSEDCTGRCLWALGRTVSSPSVPGNMKKACMHMFNRFLENRPDFKSPRAKAYAVAGLSFLNRTEEIDGCIRKLAMSLVRQYAEYRTVGWHWFEDSMTYGNAFLPLSLLMAYKALKKDILLVTARESMDFLGSITLKDGYFKPIGCNGWYTRGKTPAEFDEQPIEACETLLLYLEYYEITGNRQYLDNAVKCFYWFEGMNSKRLPLIDRETGACCDGLNESGLNRNQGSESLISHGMALMAISDKISLAAHNGRQPEKRIS